MPEGFFIGPLQVRFYGIILMLGAVAGAWLATREAKRRGHNPEIVWDLLIYLLIGGIIGARIWHILTPPPSSGMTAGWYLTHPLDALDIWKGGLGIPARSSVGMIVLYFYARGNTKLILPNGRILLRPASHWVRQLGVGEIIVNQELYGAPTNLPWKIYIDPGHRLAGFLEVEYYHPLFLYESLWNLGNMFLLLWISRRFAGSLEEWGYFPDLPDCLSRWAFPLGLSAPRCLAGRWHQH